MPYNHFCTDGTPAPPRNVLISSGPCIQVEIALHPTLAQHLQAQGQPVPAPVTGVGLIDTGASLSAIDHSVVQSLQLAPIGTLNVGGVAGPNQHLKYPAAFRFPSPTFPGINFNFVLGANIIGQGIVALIGRDVLTHFVLVYNGVLGQYILSM